MPAVNPEILVWARKTVGLSLQDAVAKVGIGNARGVAAIDRLTALERGEEKPTRPILVKMAHHYRRPLLAFYLKAPPRRDDRGPDFRKLPGARSSETDALTRWLRDNRDALLLHETVDESLVARVTDLGYRAIPVYT